LREDLEMADLSQRIARLSAEKRALLEKQLFKAKAGAAACTITPCELPDGRYPLSYAQQRIWFLEQLETRKALYNLPVALRLRGAVEVATLHTALEAVVARHASLRTRFVTSGDTPEQVIDSAQTVALTLIDQSAPVASDPGSPGESEVGSSCATVVQRVLREEAQRPFSLADNLLLRCTLVRLAEQDHILLLTMHHIASDGWSVGVLLRELAAFYGALLARRPPALPALPLRYVDFALWQRQWLDGPVLQEQMAFWRRRLQDVPPVLELPTDRPRPAAQSSRGAHLSFPLPAPLCAGLSIISQAEKATLFMTLLAAFQILLARYSGQEDVVVGTPIAGRTHSELEGLIGLFVNTLVLRTDLSGNPTFRELLARVREVTLGAYAHQDVPFDMLVKELQPERSLGHSPLFQVMFVFQNAPLLPTEFPGLELTFLPVETGTAKFDLTVALFPLDTLPHAERDVYDRGFRVEYEYNTDLFDAATITRMMGHYQTLLEGIVSGPERRIRSLPLLTEPERRQILVEWNNTRRDYPRERLLHELFEMQVDRSPDSVAVKFQDQRLRYRELNARANRLGHYLRRRGVGPDVLVGIAMQRSVEMVVGLLGVLKAGGAYVPLDTTYPRERLRFMVEDAGIGLLLTHSKLAGQLPSRGAQLICLDQHIEGLAEASPENLPAMASAEHLAYMIYTSGSTGQPKGVMVRHRGVVNYLTWCIQAYAAADGQGAPVHSPLGFDLTVTSLYAPLLTGRCALLLPEEPGVEALADAYSPDAHFGLVKITPSHLAALGQIMPPGKAAGWTRALIIGGEALLGEHIAFWQRHAPDTRLINEYGPTETIVGCCVYEVPAGAVFAGGVPIGRPIANTQVYVLDPHGQPVPVGVPGELYIGGDGVARGYQRRPELTAERFVPNRFGLDGSARLYRSGDLVRWRADGNLEFLGRLDQQVKVRGFRVELGEIETVLGCHPDVKEVAVVTREDTPGEKRLVAYVVPRTEHGPDVSELCRHLQHKLPEYMTPASFVMLKELPLTPNGKVDRRALPALDVRRPQLKQQYVAPGTPAQALICGIWTVILRLERIGIHDNFFELGGHSLVAMQVVARLREAIQQDIPLRVLFESPTIARLAASIEESGKWPVASGEKRGDGPETRDETTSAHSASPRVTQHSPLSAPITPIVRAGALPLSFAQQRLWFLAQLEPESTAYHVRIAVQLEGPLDKEALERCLDEIVRRHEVLRTTYEVDAGNPVQKIAPAVPFTIVQADLRNLSKAAREKERQRLVVEVLDRPFDLARDRMLRAGLVCLGEHVHVLDLTFHHIAMDAWSADVFFSELEGLYAAFSRNEPSPLAQLPLQYADYAVWQRQALGGEVLERQLAYWKKQLEGASAFLELSTDKPRPAVQGHLGAREELLFTRELPEAIEHLSLQEGVTPYMTLLAAFAVLLCRYTSQEDIVIGSPIAGRRRMELDPLLGFFLNTLVLRTDLAGNPTFRELLGRVRSMTLEAFEHQDLPFDRLVGELHPERTLSHAPLFQVMFVLENSAGRHLRLPGLRAQCRDVDNKSAKFDLLLGIKAGTGELRACLEYSTDLFTAPTITRMLGHYQTLLVGIVADPRCPIRRLPLLTDLERRQILVDWSEGRGREAEIRSQSSEVEGHRNRTPDLSRPANGVHELFEAQMGRTPRRLAVEFEDQRLSYRELNERANQLAYHLQKLGVGPDVPVGICLKRSVEMVIGVLGILKAGGACVPLDPRYPPTRLAIMVDDSGAALLLTQSALVQRFPRQGSKVLCMDDDWHSMAQESALNPGSPVSPEQLVYVMYTSGSTGQPKGVALPHRALVNLVAWQARQRHASAEARTLQFASLSFDVSFQEMFATWVSGGTLVLAEEAIRRDFTELARFVAARNIHRLFLPFVALQHFATAVLAQPSLSFSLEEIITAGEQLQITPAIVAVFRRLEKCALVNQYGPTESHVVTAYSLDNAPDNWPRLPPIGRPIDNAKCYVLDEHRLPVPVGVPGELHIGGVGLARGYWNRPDLTRERFIANPFEGRETRGEGPGEASGAKRAVRGEQEHACLSSPLAPRPSSLLYRTGDLVRWLADGNLEFLGRMDHQVKVRGFRVELGEIETILEGHPQVREAVATVREDVLGEKRLVAYVVPRSEVRGQRLEVGGHTAPNSSLCPPTSDLRAYLEEKFPDYMVPAAFVMLNELPLTPSGKVDRKALPAPDTERPKLDPSYAAPGTPWEDTLVKLWAEVLHLKTVGIHDNFFELGGHSLLAVRLFARIEDAFGKKLALATLFEHPTVAGIARVLQRPDRLAEERILVRMHGDGSGQPLFFTPSAGGESFFCKPLARYLGTDQAIWTFQVPEKDGHRKPFDTIETMAAFFVDQLSRSSIPGPYCLAGYSFGAAVALEMAGQLWARGEHVALLAILDWGFVQPRQRTIGRLVHSAWASLCNLPYWLVDDFLVSPRKDRLTRLLREVREIAHRLRDPWGAAKAPGSTTQAAYDPWLDSLGPEYRLLIETHLRAFNRYVPRVYPGRVTLFRSRARGLLASSVERDYGWSKIAMGGVDVKIIPGNHHTMLVEPSVRIVAHELCRALDKAQSDSLQASPERPLSSTARGPCPYG
jgi:amino acid adenylation domain-containing protein